MASYNLAGLELISTIRVLVKCCHIFATVYCVFGLVLNQFTNIQGLYCMLPSPLYGIFCFLYNKNGQL